jgi:hypothetical protein
LSGVDELFDGVRRIAEIFHEVEGDASFLAIGFVVEIDGRRLCEAIWVIFAKGKESIDGFDARECFHAEFGNETSHQLVEVLVLLLSPVPNIPLMHISNGRICGVLSSPWTSKVVVCIRNQLFASIR